MWKDPKGLKTFDLQPPVHCLLVAITKESCYNRKNFNEIEKQTQYLDGIKKRKRSTFATALLCVSGHDY